MTLLDFRKKSEQLTLMLLSATIGVFERGFWVGLGVRIKADCPHMGLGSFKLIFLINESYNFF